MNLGVRIDVETAADEVLTQLYDMPKKIKFVFRGAINDTAKQIKKHNDSLTQQTYTDRGNINPLEYHAASVGNLMATLEDHATKNVPLINFTNGGGGKGGISVVVKTTNGAKTAGKYGNLAFYHNGISVRKTPARFPLERMHSIASPVQHGNPTMWDPHEAEYEALFMQNVMARIGGYLG